MLEVGMMCSTPFGIKEGFTQKTGQLLGPCRVLNAFRHQRGIHKGTHMQEEITILCSTPFGIKEGFTRLDYK